MHLARPKSSKGRSRPAVNNSLHAGDTASIRGPPVSPNSPVYIRPDRNLHFQSEPIMWQASQLSQDEVLQMLQHAPAAPPQSLNKYKVLPSIERRQSEQRRRNEEPDLPMVKAVTQTCSSELDKRADVHLRVTPKPPEPGPIMTKEAGATGSLLLAIRAPCGRRFQQHFNPTDTLLTVKASAEVRYGVKYGDTSIETMDLPRRTFTDMNMTLAQCGILNRWLLCISQNDSMVEHE
ncbi:UBX domain-containing protein 10 isoform X2 [Micropterus dolomieu]|uniref:UBX domain-containing protein 10 isoform X2 n=1 Tax=Micropterus dolomieu TaxID=147949 RepID=UPI001E8D1166|nr:UBX domain-containing protein 10 isoform X2 [Micropterus dolomieu]